MVFFIYLIHELLLTMRLSEIIEKIGDVDALKLENTTIYNADKPHKASIHIANTFFDKGMIERNTKTLYTILIIKQRKD